MSAQTQRKEADLDLDFEQNKKDTKMRGEEGREAGRREKRTPKKWGQHPFVWCTFFASSKEASVRFDMGT